MKYFVDVHWYRRGPIFIESPQPQDSLPTAMIWIARLAAVSINKTLRH